MTIRITDRVLTSAFAESARATSAGVRKTPIRLDSDAATTAAAVSPPAIRVKTTLDWTVLGTRHRRTKPAARPAPTAGSMTPRSANPTNGKAAKVVARIATCSFQFVRPASVSAVDSRTP